MSKEKNPLKLIDAPVYGYWSALYRSFYSKWLYIDVGKRWRGMGLLYLLLAVAVFTIPFTLRVCVTLDRMYNEQVIEPLLLIPTIYVQNGEASFDKPMPYLIKNKKDEVVAIIDTSGTVTDFNTKYPKLSILVTKNAMFFKMPTPQLFFTAESLTSGVPLEQPFKKANFVLNGKQIAAQNSVSILKKVSNLIVYPIVVAILYAMLFVMFILLGFLGQVFSSVFFTFKLPFMTSCRLLMVAATPMVFLLSMLLTFDLMFPGVGFFLVGLIAIYFSLAVFSLKTEGQQMVSM